MTNELPDIFTVEEVAEYTRTSAEAVLTELSCGRLRGLRIGAEWRVTADQLRAFVGDGTVGGSGANGTGPADVLGIDWEPRDPFTYQWPLGKVESYDTAYEADVGLPSGQQHVVIGYGNRRAAGLNRRRVVVFFGHLPQPIPVVEFTGANDFDTSKRLASVIKDRTGHHVRSRVPQEYDGVATAIYRSIVAGPYAARGMAVVADAEDRDTMVRHAIIRARYKGWVRG